MIDTVEMYESRPVPVHALQWDGDDKKFDRALGYGEAYRCLTTDTRYEFWDEHGNSVYLHPGDWLVIDGHSARRYTDEQFQKFYQERPITSLADYVTDQLKESREQQPHTPTTAEIRNGVTQDESDRREAGAQFDRWLAAHDDWVIRKWIAENDVVPYKRYTQDIAAAEQRGAIKALREASHDWYKYADQMEYTPGKYYAGYWMEDRADQMEDDGGRN